MTHDEQTRTHWSIVKWTFLGGASVCGMLAGAFLATDEPLGALIFVFEGSLMAAVSLFAHVYRQRFKAKSDPCR